MIFVNLVILFTYLLKLLVGVLPDASLPAGITNALATFHAWLGVFETLFPFDTLFQLIALVLGIELIIFGFKWAVWLYNKIRGSG